MSDQKRLLKDLRVIDLRAELEKRNLDKSGVRGVLIQRLTKHLEDEGEDPTTFNFIIASENKTPVKKTRRSESTVEQESEEAPAMEDMIVQDDAGEEEEAERAGSNKAANEEQQNNVDEIMEVDDKNSRKRDIKDDSEATEAKKPCIEKDIKNDDDHKENNTDADDSINLDLGEDELLNEETDNTSKHDQTATPAMFEEDRQSGPLPIGGERPALAQLITSTDVDDAALEDTAEATGVNSTPADSDATTADVAPADSQQQVNSEAAATSNEEEKNDQEQKDEKDKEVDGEKKEKKDDNKEGGARNLWVSGLSGDTRAKDLKQLCSKHGKVIGAKVVTNARTPGSRCYGYVTMASPQDAENCIKNLHRTELHGRMISVEKAKSESESSSRRQPSRGERRPSRERKDDNKEIEEGGNEGDKSGEPKVKREGEASGGESARSTSRTRENSHRSDKDRVRRSTRSRERRRSPRDVLSFSKIWKERDEARARERSRAAREEERRRRAAEDALRERERRQRQEKHRLAIERDKLRAEREKIEREKNELLRLERERHRLEREKLELERLELKRAQLRLEEERRKRGYESSSAYRKPAASPPPEPAYDREPRHKRPPPPNMSSSRGQFEAPPPPRFDISSGGGYDRGADKRDRERDYKRDYPRHVSSANMKYPSNGSSNDDARQPMPPGSRPKEPSGKAPSKDIPSIETTRALEEHGVQILHIICRNMKNRSMASRSYESRDNRSYRPSPPGKPEPRSWNPSNRYPDSAPPSKGGGSGGGEGWAGGEQRYGSYEARYAGHAPHAATHAAPYQPPPPGAPYPDRYAPQPRDYPRKY